MNIEKLKKVAAALIIVISIIWILIPIFTSKNSKIKTIDKPIIEYINGTKAQIVILEDDTKAVVTTDAKLGDILTIYNNKFFCFFPSDKQNFEENSDSYFGYSNPVVTARLSFQIIFMIILPSIYLYTQ